MTAKQHKARTSVTGAAGGAVPIRRPPKLYLISTHTVVNNVLSVAASSIMTQPSHIS